MTADEAKKLSPWLPRAFDLAALVFCGILIFSHLSWINEPWDNSHCGVNSGAYYGYACRGLNAFGYFESRMQGPLLFHPSGEGLFIPYTNHPGSIYTIFYPAWRYLGQDEAALRYPILAVLILNLLLLRFGLAPFLGRIGAAAATAGFASLPMILHYGKMVDIPLFCLALFVPVTASWLRWRRSGGEVGWWLFFALAFLAALLDWFSYFLAFGLGLEILFSRDSWRHRLVALRHAAAPFVLGFAVVLSWLCWAEGSLDRCIRAAQGLLLAAGIGSEKVADRHFLESVSWGEWGEAVMHNASQSMTLWFLIPAALGLLIALLRPEYRREVLLPGVMLLTSGLMPLLAFRTHASRHEFWPMVALAGLTFFFGLAFRWLTDCSRSRNVSVGVSLVVLVLVCAWNTGRAHAYHEARVGQTNQLELAQDLNRDFGPRDLVFCSDSLSPSRFYRNFLTVPQVTTPRFANEAIERIRPFAHQFDRVFLLWNKACRSDPTWLSTFFPARGTLQEASYANQHYFKRELDLKKLFAK